MLTKCILVVDDDKMNLMRTKKILEKTYAVLLAESGEVALTKLKTRKVDLVLLDIAIELGAANYLKKPFYPQELLKRVAKELDLK